MFKILPILLMCFMLQGCSLLKIVSAPFQAVKNSVPQSTETNKEIIKCKGKLEILADGTILCEKGFTRVANNYQQVDRKLSLREKIAQFIAHGTGYLVYGIIISIILTATGFGWVISAFWQGVFGIGRTLKQVVKGVQDARKNNKDLNQALAEAMDEKTKLEIARLKEKENIK